MPTEEIITKIDDDTASITTPTTNIINVEEVQQEIINNNQLIEDEQASRIWAIDAHNVEIARIDWVIAWYVSRNTILQYQLDKAESVWVIPTPTE